MKDKETKENKGFAFVTFTAKDVAQRAIEELHDKEHKGRTLRCSLSQAKHRLFVGNVPKGLSEAELTSIIKGKGPGVVNIEMFKDLHDPSRNRGFLFVEYYNHACADYARLKLSSPDFKVDGSQLTVSWAEPKGSTSSSSSASDSAAQVKTIYVKNLPENVSKEKVKDLFEEHGEVTKVVLPPAKAGHKRDFGFVHFAERSSALKVVKGSDKYEIDGLNLEEKVWIIGHWNSDLALLGCECSGSVSFALPLLERCRLDFVGSGSCALALAAPRVESLEVQGFNWIVLQGGERLKRLTIAKNTGSMTSVGIERLPVLEQLSLRGIQWSWGAVSYLLQCAAEVKHLVMKVEFCGDYDTLQPFPKVDLVEFFNSHPKLRKFEVHGAMFAALCQKNSLKNLDSRFSISSLEEVLITVRSPLNAEQKLITLESPVCYSPMLQAMVIRISQMKNCHEAADEFFEEICKFAHVNKGRVRIE